MCGICRENQLGIKPCLRLGCNHVFHAECISKQMRERTTKRISEEHLQCPTCKTPIELNGAQVSPLLTEQLNYCKAQRIELVPIVLQIYEQENLESVATEE